MAMIYVGTVLMRTDSWKCPTGDDRTWMFYDSGGASNKKDVRLGASADESKDSAH